MPALESATRLRVLSLVTDCYGGRGGIAQYNRHILRAIASDSRVASVTVIPRVISYAPNDIPSAVVFHADAAVSAVKYLQAILAQFVGPPIDLIVCGHINLLPFAAALQLRWRCRVALQTYGIEAWSPTRRAVVNWLARRVTILISIRKLTGQRFESWSQARIKQFFYLPNCVDTSLFRPSERDQQLVRRWNLDGRRVAMIAGRMETAAFERMKGFDELISAMPQIRSHVPDVTLVVVGDGADQPRLKMLATELGVADAVVFTGYVDEKEKPDYFALADVFAMPGSNPVFDRYPFRFVYLEALACGIPVVCPRADGPDEATDPLTCALLQQVDPNDPTCIADAVIQALQEPSAIRRDRAAAVEALSYNVFEHNVHQMIAELCPPPT